MARGDVDLTLPGTEARLFTGGTARLLAPIGHEFTAGPEGAEVSIWVTA